MRWPSVTASVRRANPRTRSSSDPTTLESSRGPLCKDSGSRAKKHAAVTPNPAAALVARDFDPVGKSKDPKIHLSRQKEAAKVSIGSEYLFRFPYPTFSDGTGTNPSFCSNATASIKFRERRTTEEKELLSLDLTVVGNRRVKEQQMSSPLPSP